ncbi:hypothetical protein GOP47_0018432 [Adiantum capillus-veneris]|uniref:FRIGIDA-like protein n=1 Tax=Adiantum capillus-veneris TaxID=13818 RepID=A0A9D4UE33_ADICA|nr:hypothetical protein GOP47_0018432 [Adiantum capillus-veneris]
MATPKEAFDFVSERKEQLRKVFTEFEAKKFSLGRIGSTWKDIEEHFKEIETCLEKTHEAYKAKEKAFEDRMKSVQAELDKLDAEVYAKEQASVSRVQSQKDAAVAAILEQKRKLADDKRKWDVEKQRFEAGGRATGVSEKDSQFKKDSAIVKTSTSTKDIHATKISAGKKTDTKERSTQVEKTPAPPKVHREPRPKLKNICQNMDPDGFRKFIVENQKDLKTLQEEVPSALKLCSDPAQLVLKTLEGYLDMDEKVKQEFSKDDCFSCTMLLECLSEVLGDNHVVSGKVKISAKDFSDKLKAMLKLEGQIGFSMLLVGRSFLQFVATFGLSSEYNQDELCDIVAKVARHKQAAIVFRSLRLSGKAPDMVERLIKDSKLIEAVTFVSEFNLLERFPPAPLLKSHLREARKAAKSLLKNGSNSLAAQNEALQKELGALRSVASVVRECKLEDHFKLDDVDKQIATLEQTKAERKRVATASKAQQPSKRPRADDGSPTGGQRGSLSPGKALQGPHERGLYNGSRIPPPYGPVSVPDHKPGPLGDLERRPLGEFDRRLVDEYERRDIERRRLGLFDPAYAASSRAPISHGHPSLSLPSLGYRSTIPNGHPAYGYSVLPSLGMGGFKPYL